jgi:hypothetical protein
MSYRMGREDVAYQHTNMYGAVTRNTHSTINSSQPFCMQRVAPHIAN